MTTTRKWIAAGAGAMAASMVPLSAAWACGSFAGTDMAITNVDDDYDPGSTGLNYTECLPTRLAVNGCTRTVKVTGKNFVNSDNVAITSVKLYWVDEPFYAAGLGGPNGTAEQAESFVCQTAGIPLNGGAAVPVTNKAFDVDVEIPPPNHTAMYGVNMVCAVWEHVPTTGQTHFGSIGNQYAIYPA